MKIRVMKRNIRTNEIESHITVPLIVLLDTVINKLDAIDSKEKRIPRKYEYDLEEEPT